jgi:hypothetical protein
MLLAQLTFGLRMKEVLCLRPWKADSGSGLNVYPGDGPKGGRPCFIPYLVPEKAVIINEIKARMKKTHKLGWLCRAKDRVTSEINMRSTAYVARS